MTSSRSLRVAARARRDVRAILRHSFAVWGEDQRDAYAVRLSAAIDGLTRTPYLGRAREDLAPGMRGHPVGEHVVSYQVDPVSVTIIRVLHQKRDAAKEFGI